MMMSSAARDNSAKTKATFRYHTKGVSNQISSNLVLEIKRYSCSNSSTKMGKTKKWENKFWLTKRENKGIANRGRFLGLQIRARWITNRGNFRDFKSGQKDYKLGQGFQIGANRF